MSEDASRKLDCAKLISHRQVLWSEGRDGGVFYQCCYGDTSREADREQLNDGLHFYSVGKLFLAMLLVVKVAHSRIEPLR